MGFFKKHDNMLDQIKIDLPSAEWFVQAFHDAFCPIEEVGLPFETWKNRHPNKTVFEVRKDLTAC